MFYQHKWSHIGILDTLQGVNEPIVGIVVTISPNFSLYRMVVFPAASKPTIKMRISFLPQRRSNNFENVRPMFAVFVAGAGKEWVY